MSSLTSYDVRPAPTVEFAQKLLGNLYRMLSTQAVAATANNTFQNNGSPQVLQKGTIRDLFLVSSQQAAVGESMVFDVQISTDDGAKFRCVRTYVAGGSPAMTYTTVGIEFCD